MRYVPLFALIVAVGCTDGTPSANAPAVGQPILVEPGEHRATAFDGRVQVVFPAKGLVFTRAQLEAGVDLHVRVEVEKPVVGIYTAPPISVPKGPEGPSDLQPQLKIAGGDQCFRDWDYGRVPRSEFDTTPRDVAPGQRDYVLRWTGRNWEGPSDCHDELGEPFPPGTYTFSATFAGELAGKPYSVECSVPLVIQP